MNGSHVLTESWACDGTFLYQITGGSSSDPAASSETVDVVIGGVEPVAGATARTPDVQVRLKFKTIDDGVYPAAGQGSCSMTGEGGAWGVAALFRFACDGLVGVGSGASFSIKGRAACL